MTLLPIGSNILYFDPLIASLGRISGRVRRSSIAAAPLPTMQEQWSARYDGEFRSAGRGICKWPCEKENAGFVRIQRADARF